MGKYAPLRAKAENVNPALKFYFTKLRDQFKKEENPFVVGKYTISEPVRDLLFSLSLFPLQTIEETKSKPHELPGKYSDAVSNNINLLCTAFNLNISQINKYFSSVQFISPGFKTTDFSKPVSEHDLTVIIRVCLDMIHKYYKDTENTYPESYCTNQDSIQGIKDYYTNKVNEWNSLLKSVDNELNKLIELSLHGLADAGKTVLKTGVSTVTTVVKNPCCCLPSQVQKKKQQLDLTKHASEAQRYQKLTNKYEERSEIIYNIIRRLYDVDFPIDSWSGNEKPQTLLESEGGLYNPVADRIIYNLENLLFFDPLQVAISKALVMCSVFNDRVSSTVEEVITGNAFLLNTAKFIYKSYYPYMRVFKKNIEDIIKHKAFVAKEHMVQLDKIYTGMKKQISNVMNYIFFLDDNFVIPVYDKIVELYETLMEFGKTFFPNVKEVNPLDDWLEVDSIYKNMKREFHNFWKKQSKFEIQSDNETFEVFLHPSKKHKILSTLKAESQGARIISLPPQGQVDAFNFSGCLKKMDLIFSFGESVADRAITQSNFQEFYDLVENSSDNIIVRVITRDPDGIANYPLNAITLMNIVSVACSLFEAIFRLDEGGLFKNYMEDKKSLYSIISLSFFTPLFNDLKFLFQSRVKTSKGLDPNVLELIKSIKSLMKRVPASGSTLKNLMRTSIRDILYQWIIMSRYRIIKNSIPQVIENNNWMPISESLKHSRVAGSELSWLVQQHIDFLKDIPYESVPGIRKLFAFNIILEPIVRYCEMVMEHSQKMLPNEKDLVKYRRSSLLTGFSNLFGKKDDEQIEEMLRFKFFDFFEGDQVAVDNYLPVVMSLCVHLNDINFLRIELYDKMDYVSKLQVDEDVEQEIEVDEEEENVNGISLDTVSIEFQQAKSETYSVTMIIMKAENLPKGIGSIDPYMKVRLAKNETELGEKKYQQFKTQVEKSTVNPQFRFHSPETWGTITGRSCLIDFEVRDKQLLSSESISEAFFKFNMEEYTTAKDVTIDLLTKKGKPGGTLTISLKTIKHSKKGTTTTTTEESLQPLDKDRRNSQVTLDNLNGIADLTNLKDDLVTYKINCLVKSASHLPVGDVISSDPYLIVYLSQYKSVLQNKNPEAQSEIQTFKTPIVKNTLNPEYNMMSPTSWGSMLSQKSYLYVECFDWDENNADDLLCTGELELDYYVYEKAKPVNITMKREGKDSSKTGGIVHLEILIEKSTLGRSHDLTLSEIETNLIESIVNISFDVTIENMIKDTIFNVKKMDNYDSAFVKSKAKLICQVLEQQLYLFEKYLYNGVFKKLLLHYFDVTMVSLGYILLTYTSINPKVDYESNPKEYAKPNKSLTGSYDHLHPDQIKIIQTFYDVFVSFYSEFGIKSKYLYERSDYLHLLIDLVSQTNGEDLYAIFEPVIEEAKKRREERKKKTKFFGLLKTKDQEDKVPPLEDMKSDLKNGVFDITEPIVMMIMKKMFPSYKKASDNPAQAN